MEELCQSLFLNTIILQIAIVIVQQSGEEIGFLCFTRVQTRKLTESGIDVKNGEIRGDFIVNDQFHFQWIVTGSVLVVQGKKGTF
jgi:hypothetical protein